MVAIPPTLPPDSLTHRLAGLALENQSRNYATIPVRSEEGILKLAKVDPIDVHFKSFSWWEGNGGYPRRSTKIRMGESWRTVTLYLHTEIAGLSPGGKEFQVHHANHNVLDCRRSNLWLCTPAFNARHQKRAIKSMLEELWATPAEDLECWPLGDRRRALGQLLLLHKAKHGSWPLEAYLPDILRKLEEATTDG